MKKPSKLDIVLCVSIIVAALLGFVEWLATLIGGNGIPWLEETSKILLYLPMCVITGEFCSNVLIQIVEYYKEKKNKK